MSSIIQRILVKFTLLYGTMMCLHFSRDRDMRALEILNVFIDFKEPPATCGIQCTFVSDGKQALRILRLSADASEL